MPYAEIIAAIWSFIKEFIKIKKSNSKTKDNKGLPLFLLTCLAVSLLFNMFLLIRVYIVSKEYLETKVINERTIRVMSEMKPPVVGKTPITAPPLPTSEPKKLPLKQKPVKPKVTEQRIKDLKAKFDKIKGTEEN